MRNIEAKFKLRDLERARERALAMGFAARGEFEQRDTFFVVANGKLKLREQEGAGASMIYYSRERYDRLDLSNYEIVMVADGAAMRAVLAAALGVLAEVRKQRTLLTRANVRLHLDRIDGLGEFGEIEAVLAEDDSVAANQAAAREILTGLGITDADRVEMSYFELLLKRK
ncbi:MAG: class IV adenylate cyclase [Candidatus Binataceae bacterium]